MINVVGPVSSAAAVEAPVTINRADAQPAPFGPAIGFSIGDLLPRVLRYFPPALEMGKRKTAHAFDRRFLDR